MSNSHDIADDQAPELVEEPSDPPTNSHAQEIPEGSSAPLSQGTDLNESATGTAD
jgi:hypothetical protein